METMDLWENERSRWSAGTVCGCDEAGAGPLAGPVYAAAVVLRGPVPGLDDSKKLTAKKREALYELITADGPPSDGRTSSVEQLPSDGRTPSALSWAVARVEAAEIDDTDILSARLKAMQLAIDALSLDRGAALPPGVTAVGGVPVRPELALVDGNRDRGRYFSLTFPHKLIVGGDGLSASIAAASVLAKVSRDRYVSRELDALYPHYRFAQHKGYGTKLHIEMLDRYGPCPAHRKSFLKKWGAKRGGNP